MPKGWKNQVSKIENCRCFNGRYALSYDNKGLLSENREYNDLIYFQNTPDRGLKELPWLTSISIKVTDVDVTINLFSYGELVHKSNFKKGSFECKNNTLILHLEDEYKAEDIVQFYFVRTITLYMAISDEVFVKSQYSGIGTIALVPAVTGENKWFKLRKI